MLYFPFRLLFLPENVLCLKCRLFLLLLFLWFMYLHPFSLTNSLMLANSIWQKFSATFPTWDKICILISTIIFIFLLLKRVRFALNWLLLLFDFAQRTFVDIGLFHHWTYLASFLMRYQWFRVKFSWTIFALDQSLLDEGVKRFRVKFIDIIPGDLILGN